LSFDLNQIGDNTIFAIGVGVAILLFFRYCWNHRKHIVFLSSMSLFILSQALIGGLLLCLKTTLTTWCNLSGGAKMYVFMGGMAAIWNAIAGIGRIIEKPLPK